MRQPLASARTCLVLVALVAAPAVAETPWDADEVLALATELDESIASALEMAPKAPQQETAFQQRTRDAAVEKLKYAREASRTLVEKLRLGWDREESEFYFDRLASMLRDVRTTARDAVPQAEVLPLIERIERLQFLLTKRYETT